MAVLALERCCRSPRARGSLSPRCGVALCSSLLAVLLLAHLLDRSRSEQRLDTAGWRLRDFVAHVQQRGVQLHVVSGDTTGGPFDSVYLTENPNATRGSLLRKVMMVERIDQWRGTVWV